MNEKSQKVAVLGGTFDPMTNAHLEIIRKLSKKFSRVVVLPCYISPFKLGGASASGEDRVKMLRKVTADLENVKVSKWEIKQEKISYTADAVRHYKQKYENAELYFVIGSDCVNSLTEWREADYLAENVTFCLIKRPGYAVSKTVMQELSLFGFKFVPAGFKTPDSSSSLARAAVAFNKHAEVVPLPVAEYITEHELYGDYVPFVKGFKIFGLKGERIDHTFRAVKAGITLSKIYGEDVNEAITALILHDIGKNATRSSLSDNGINVENYSKISSESPSVLHAYVSAAIARDYYGLNERIVSAIEKHTTGSSNMSMLDKIVYMADAIEEGRTYEGVESLRRLAYKDIDKAMLRSLKATVKNLKEENKPICPVTIEARDYFKKLCAYKAAQKKAAPVFSDEKSEIAKKEEVPKKAVKPADKQVKTGAKKGRALAEYIAEKLSEKKGRDVVIIDVAQKTVIADCFVIAGAGSATAVKAMADYVDEKMSKDMGIEPLRRDVSQKWAVLDYGDVIVHVQHEEAREYYRLEKLWDNGDNITHFDK